jgi:hypothetical protein
MKFFVYATTVALSLCGTNGWAEEQAKPVDHTDTQSFELTAVAPPKPALKYQFMFDDLGDRLPGNAAILYLDSVLLLGTDTREKVQRAVEFRGTDKEQFGTLADSLELPSLMKELELAGRRKECDWQPPYREMGAETLLPHLEPLVRGIGRLLWVRAHRQIEQGKPEEAVKTIRLGYEMADKIGREGILVSGMVALSVDGMMDECVAELMSRPESPNLYWSLCELPTRWNVFRRSLDGERQWALTSIPNLAKVRAGEQLSADEWRGIFANIQRIMDLDQTAGHAHLSDMVKDTDQETLKTARRDYAAAHGLSAAQAAEVEPICVLGEYYYHQYELAYDEWFKLRGLAYPAMIERSKNFDAWAEKLKQEQPGNLLVQSSPKMVTTVGTFARADRRLAALVAVEALRTFAAANGGRLPEHLEDVSETPVPPNPMTGRPFAYAVADGVASISDSTLGDRLEYTIKFRK